MEILLRRNDVVTDAESLAEELYVFKGFPVNMLADGDSDPDKDLKFDMKIGINPDSGVIQLTELLHQENVYVDTHSNAIGQVWKEHHTLVASAMRKYAPEHVLEIGGGGTRSNL